MEKRGCKYFANKHGRPSVFKGCCLKSQTLHEKELCPATLLTILSRGLVASGLPRKHIGKCLTDYNLQRQR